MSRRTQITLSDRQHAYLVGESARTGLSLAALVRVMLDPAVRVPGVPGLGRRARRFGFA